MATSIPEPELVRKEVNRLLASPEFASSAQSQSFLRFTSERALAGVEHLEQVEIAREVLGRGTDFNPVEDAAVRKLASQVRHRLEQCYAKTGAGTELTVALPVRSYVPRFDVKTTETAPLSDAPRKLASFRKLTVAVALVLTAMALATAWWNRHRATELEEPLVLQTEKGDIAQGASDAPPQAVRIGRELQTMDAVTARLTFSPSQEAQQAGLLVWEDNTHFIELGRKFFGRNRIEFSLHEDRRSNVPRTNIIFDSDGQSGAPVWLTIRREHDTYSAFLSSDGSKWQRFGEPLVSASFRHPRAAVFALNGRRNAPSIPASFSGLSTGLDFGAATANFFQSAAQSGWTTDPGCQGTSAVIAGSTLTFELPRESGNCGIELGRKIEGSDWEYSTRLDFYPAPGRSAGLRVQGSKGSIRLARYFLNGPSIAFIHDGKTLVGVPDLNGSPGLILRLASRRGIIHAAYSVDGKIFVFLPIHMKTSDLGANLRAVLRFSSSATDPDEPAPVAKFSYFHEALRDLKPYRSG